MRNNEKQLPDFLIIGAMKCATSTLHVQLSMHDSFFMSDPKEIDFFSNDEIFSKGINWYISHFDEAGPHELKGESSTSYTKLPQYPNTAERIASICDGVKFIYVMRHPIDRLISHYIHEWTQGVISCKIDKALERYPELIDYGRYNMQIEPYLNTFGKGMVLPVFLERIKDNPSRELERIFNFLNIKEKSQWREEIKTNVSSERLRAAPWRDAIVKNQIVTFIRRKFIPKKIRNTIKDLWTMKERPVLSEDSELFVKKIFNEDLKHLGDRLGFELNCDNWKDTVRMQNTISWKNYE